MLTKLTGRLSDGAIIVAGTNGKTTTSRMLADVLEAGGLRVVHNRSGSNLVRGVAAAFAAQASVTGDPRGQIGVIETDEAAFPEIVRRVQPRLILLNNLFRDQLDRYGELNTIATAWQAALATLPAEATVVVNVDDPALAAITEGLQARRVGFGLDETRHTLEGIGHAVDSVVCRRCGHDLAYDALYSSHLGKWHCPNCGNARPPLDIAGRDIRLNGVETLEMTITFAGSRALPIEVGVPGLYNAYNALAATAAASTLGVPDHAIQAAFRSFRSAFGRIERATIDGRTLTLALIKNPVGCNEVLRMLTQSVRRPAGRAPVPTLISINDLDADGRDVSWLWDADFELLATGHAPLYTSGIRGADMANRLKYAGVSPERIKSPPARTGRRDRRLRRRPSLRRNRLHPPDLHGDARPPRRPCQPWSCGVVLEAVSGVAGGRAPGWHRPVPLAHPGNRMIWLHHIRRGHVDHGRNLVPDAGECRSRPD